MCTAPDGREVSCGAAEAGLLTRADACTSDSVRQSWGLAEDPRQLSFSVAPQGTWCRVEPGKEARAAGASAAYVKEIANGTIPDSLLLCAASAGGPDIACSQPHRFEYVGSALPVDRQPPADVCVEPARRYANRAFTASRDPLTPKLLTWKTPNGFTYRCGIESERPMARSVWQVGEGDGAVG